MPLDHLVHEIRWSNGTQVVQPHASGPSGPAASRHARRRPTMRDAQSGRSGNGGAGTAPPPLHPARPRRPAPPIPPRPTPPGAPGGDPGGPSRPAPRPSALDNTSHHTRGTHSEPLPEQPSQYRLPEIRPDARRITFPEDYSGVSVWGGWGSCGDSGGSSRPAPRPRALNAPPAPHPGNALRTTPRTAFII